MQVDWVYKLSRCNEAMLNSLLIELLFGIGDFIVCHVFSMTVLRICVLHHKNPKGKFAHHCSKYTSITRYLSAYLPTGNLQEVCTKPSRD